MKLMSKSSLSNGRVRVSHSDDEISIFVEAIEANCYIVEVMKGDDLIANECVKGVIAVRKTVALYV